MHLRRAVLSLPLGLLLASPALAERATCEDLLAARAGGASVEEVARAHATTRARVEACARIAEQHERLARQRDEVAAARLQRTR